MQNQRRVQGVTTSQSFRKFPSPVTYTFTSTSPTSVLFRGKHPKAEQASIVVLFWLQGWLFLGFFYCQFQFKLFELPEIVSEHPAWPKIPLLVPIPVSLLVDGPHHLHQEFRMSMCFQLPVSTQQHLLVSFANPQLSTRFPNS